jgi:hypothetical protein
MSVRVLGNLFIPEKSNITFQPLDLYPQVQADSTSRKPKKLLLELALDLYPQAYAVSASS